MHAANSFHEKAGECQSFSFLFFISSFSKLFPIESYPVPRDCDRARIRAFRYRYLYEFAALVECETRARREPARVVEWLPG